MKASKAIALAGIAALSVLAFNYALKVATEGLLIDERDEAATLAEAPAEAPRKILAPATATPEVADAGDAPEPADMIADQPFGAPDPEFGQANPAQGEPAWGAVERARQAEAAAAASAAEEAPAESS